MKSTLANRLGSLVVAIHNCQTSGNVEWENRHSESMADYVKNHMPSGSGVDTGTKLEPNDCQPEKLVFTCSFHHMNDAGMYDGWTDHKIIVTPSFVNGFTIRITGSNRNDIKSYLADIYGNALETIVEY